MTSKQMLHDVFVTALEGGIGYWSQAASYHWSKGDTGELEDCDLDGFYADIIDVEDGNKPYRIDKAVIRKGIVLLARGEAKHGESFRGIASQLAFGDPDVDFDADDADAVVQAGLFGEVVYG